MNTRLPVAAAALTALALTAATCEPDDVIVIPVGCNCYYTEQCVPGQVCNYGAGCTDAGKQDGKCSGPISTGGPFDPLGTDDDTRMAIELFDRAFRAYEEPIRRGGGHPNAALWAEIDSMAPTTDVASAVKRLANTSLDVTMGFDFNYATGESAGIGNIRLVEDEAAMLALLDATRVAVTQALERRDPTAVRAPLEAFWKRHASYHPAHSGRCFPHGHPEFTKLFDGPLDCQARTLERTMSVILRIGE